jgi:hypothetical protein
LIWNNIPLKERIIIEDVSTKLRIRKWKIQFFLKGLLRRHSKKIKSYLTDANKKSQLKWCFDMIEQGLVGDPRFNRFLYYVFIDEK